MHFSGMVYVKSKHGSPERIQEFLDAAFRKNPDQLYLYRYGLSPDRTEAVVLDGEHYDTFNKAVFKTPVNPKLLVLTNGEKRQLKYGSEEEIWVSSKLQWLTAQIVQSRLEADGVMAHSIQEFDVDQDNVLHAYRCDEDVFRFFKKHWKENDPEIRYWTI